MTLKESLPQLHPHSPEASRRHIQLHFWIKEFEVYIKLSSINLEALRSIGAMSGRFLTYSTLNFYNPKAKES